MLEYTFSVYSKVSIEAGLRTGGASLKNREREMVLRVERDWEKERKEESLIGHLFRPYMYLPRRPGFYPVALMQDCLKTIHARWSSQAMPNGDAFIGAEVQDLNQRLRKIQWKFGEFEVEECEFFAPYIPFGYFEFFEFVVVRNDGMGMLDLPKKQEEVWGFVDDVFKNKASVKKIIEEWEDPLF